MRDPNPENISGEKRVVHSVEHRINWGYVVIGVAVLYVAWKVSGVISAEQGREEEEQIEGAAVIVDES